MIIRCKVSKLARCCYTSYGDAKSLSSLLNQANNVVPLLFSLSSFILVDYWLVLWM